VTEPKPDVVPAAAPSIDVSVIVPTRNAADWIVECLESILASRPAEIILVDGHSDDGTVALAQGLVDRVLRDEGGGPGAARNLGVAEAKSRWVAFIDADVVVPPEALGALLNEARERSLVALQAGLRSHGTDYWSDQLAWHHNHGRSRSWFGVSATVMRRDVAKSFPFDDTLRSGEDIDLRLRLAEASMPVGVSESVVVDHRFAPTFGAARDQWTADGAGLGRLVRKFGAPGLRHLAVPFGAAAYWLARSVVAPRRLPYFLGFLLGNWWGAIKGLEDGRVALGTPSSSRSTLQGLAMLWFGAALAVLAAIGLVVLIVLGLPALAGFVSGSAWLPLVALATVGLLVWVELSETLPKDHRWRRATQGSRRRILGLVGVMLVLTLIRLGANLRLLG
jgi:glycosyltransferase involved in cell wall biosynthesis